MSENLDIKSALCEMDSAIRDEVDAHWKDMDARGDRAMKKVRECRIAIIDYVQALEGELARLRGAGAARLGEEEREDSTRTREERGDEHGE